ncbi:dicarboxylate/amino acid:cation symporter [archaeon]|nr:dicarboxylate/amino acid:cation symporter [archaeon]NCP79354.1 dicarboxylate/amino acid:cation symporter [archaeon]NCP97297.1 dicarboxylate/amino acid:cation symporter [archaeon]NCQ07121.1 dicarboxylate/amino acid:cation symporter [archaeon]NCQ50917.1 dicarboxylate/amino acid:cation symporter [archaeon]
MKNPLQFIKKSSITERAKSISHLLHNKLYLKVLIALFFGILVGFILGPTFGFVSTDISKIITEWLALPGYVFLSLIQMIVIPLIFASIIKGIASNESSSKLKKIGLSITIYFIITTVIAIIIGIGVANIIQPGKYITSDQISAINVDGSQEVVTTEMPKIEKIPEMIGDIFPKNVLSSMLKGDMLPIVIFSIIFGIALINLKKTQSKPLLDVLSSIQDVSIMIVKWAMVLAPLAVFGLMAKISSQFGISTLVGLGVYILTVMLGLILLICVYLLIVYFSTKQKPFTFLGKISEAQLLAFSTSSSAVVMPLSIKTAEDNLKIRKSISQFIIPLGTTINMDGTALYQAIATIFLAQVFGIEISFLALVLLIVTIVGASIGTPGTPGVGIVILSMALTTVGVPLSGIALIIGVDRILDMMRTTVNVTGDLTAATFINKFIK